MRQRCWACSGYGSVWRCRRGLRYVFVVFAISCFCFAFCSFWMIFSEEAALLGGGVASTPLQPLLRGLAVSTWQGCDMPRSSFESLGDFWFWGQKMNSSWPCLTSGMNNQLMLLMGRLHCLAVRDARRGAAPSSSAAPSAGNPKHMSFFKWNDITCSPMGGKEGRHRYAVGGDDYTYTWFRWSELLVFADIRVRRGTGGAVGPSQVTLGPLDNVDTSPQPAEVHVTRVCLSDAYGWSEQPSLLTCPASVDHIWGTAVYWDLRRSLRPHTWFARAALDFLRRRGISPSPLQKHMHAVMALHVRRGDYKKFCRENEHGRGRHKYRVPPFVYLKRWRHVNSSILGTNFWEECHPSLLHIVATIANVTQTYTHITKVMLMTNVARFRAQLAVALRGQPATRHLTLLSFVAASADNAGKDTDVGLLHVERAGVGEVPPSYWPRHATYYTESEAAWMDLTLISLAEVMVLNRYSTFSHSAVDLHILREKRLAAKLFWW
ncbi:hypothetical protein TraAM80_01524 [Trypanosoma rangeli]|uniref:Uncharacterized protein n=1 Tax=Trypanosoma rangeli TaxID=5698 RepID=A0A3R7M7I1_TRYRA|nr:uncharacterized protein TraAM80_01524 [Trypanosoma rangeli]RNF10478.1 hypothetical protein TraAM80_01524 [Trypanosoma rangeli]|eukprot:RNF10478.1 hypothetical protein TraAM80_01524 [Trypanosoma rangeli]